MVKQSSTSSVPNGAPAGNTEKSHAGGNGQKQRGGGTSKRTPIEAFNLSDCETPVAFERDSPSNARSKFNAEGGEWSQPKSYLSVSGSKVSQRSASLREGLTTPKAYGKCTDMCKLSQAKKSVSPQSICSNSNGSHAAHTFNICQFSDQFSSKTMKHSQGSH